ncbi:MAG: hypothetical protein FWG90_11925 [Oscillospiraceae bacterium]|nr:hypothetical protein [Oscillospiraceae bacterium]
MLNEKFERILQFDGNKPIELMTAEERDDYFISISGMNYDDWCEHYKDDTLESLREELRVSILKYAT